MTKYLDEYIPKSKQVARQVQSDTDKLKFNNIQSCAALVLVPKAGNKMVGVHVSTASVRNKAELKELLTDLQAGAGQGTFDAYLTCCWANYKGSDLLKALKKLVRAVYLCDMPHKALKAPNPDHAANIDAKFHLLGGVLQASIRESAVPLKKPDGPGFIKRPDFDAKKWAASPGKPHNLTDRDDKPWKLVQFTRIFKS